jgi:NAD(P)-dependent dehydrogenase (short-subunit alcohol dehydrogenase family)
LQSIDIGFCTQGSHEVPNLNGRTFAVTGASGNLGRAVRDVLLRDGANVVLLDRSDHSGSASTNPKQTLSLGGLDLTDTAAVGRALDEAIARFGRIHGLVATIGAFSGGGTGSEDGWTVWDDMLTANLKTTVAAVQAIVPRLPREGGRIVTVGARPGLAGVKGLSAYSASKAAVLRLTESRSEELKHTGVTVNSVLPNIIDTPQNREAMPDADHSRWVPAQDIAEVIAFLLSDSARAVTGALIPVYGKS